MPITQAKRQIQVFTSLPVDKLVFYRMEANESLGRLFQFELALLSEDESIKIDDLLSQKMTVQVDLPGGGKRYFNGHVAQFTQVANLGRFAHYRAVIRPWLWFLTRTADCRIFQNKTVPDIIKEVFRELGFTDFEELLSKSYRQWDYCVQYRETDFNFVSRLMEQEGMYYFFKHEKEKHTLVFSDSISSHKPFPGYADVPYYPPEDREGTSRLQHIYDWSVSKSVQPGRYAHTDFDFKKPKADISANSPLPRKHANANFEIYDYPGVYRETGEGATYARTRIEELQTEHEQVNGTSNARGIATGSLFTLSKYPRDDQNREYLIISTEHVLQADAYEANQPQSGGEQYESYFTAISSQEIFRPARITPKPVGQGPQPAMVVGKSGEEIWTDEYGRVKVQFHWDRYGKKDENSSCWIRVAQIWAGKKWGGMYIPRIGQEVIIEFLEGDPDHPIVTGRVYNGDSMPPYGLPDNKTMSTVKSNSSKGGGGYNEIRFEDKKGKEQVYIHAERDQDNWIKNDAREWVGQNRHLVVKGKQAEKVGGSKHLNVSGDHNEQVGGTVSVKAGMDLQTKVGKNYAVDSGMEVHLKAGMNVVIEGGMQLTIKAAGGFIDIGPAGITIQGTLVRINSGGAAGSGSGASPKKPAKPEEAPSS